MSKSFGNVGVLDLTHATEESIKGIDKIGNIGLVFYRAGDSKLLSMLNIGNLGSTEEVPEGCKLLQGKVEMDSMYFKNIKEPVSMFISGQLIIKQDVTEEDIEKGISFLSIKGQLVCPEKLAGIMRQKCSKLEGQVIPYSDNFYLSIGNINIDTAFLKSLNQKTSLALIGKISIIDNIDIELFKERIAAIDVIGKLLIKEEYLYLIENKTRSSAAVKMEVIPEGYCYISDNIYLDSLSITKFNGDKIFTAGMLRFSDDITVEMLKKHILRIKAKDIIVCNDSLKEAVYMMSDDNTVRIYSYSGMIRIIDGDHTLMQSELKYMPGKISYIIRGDLKIDDDVLPETFMEKVETIDNFGDITCDKEHYGLVQLKLRINEGDVTAVDVNDNKEDEKEDGGIGNIGYLKL